MKPRGNYGLGSKLTKNQRSQVPKFYMTYATGTEAKSGWTLVSPAMDKIGKTSTKNTMSIQYFGKND